MYLVTPVYLIVLYIYNIKTGSVWHLYGTLFPAWFLFYILGIDCRSGKFDNIIKKANVWWIIAAIFLSLFEVRILQYLMCSESFVVSQITFSSFLYIITLLFWLQKKSHDIKRNILSVLGDYSYGIFYCHILVLQVVNRIIQMFGLNRIWIINFIVSFIFATAGSVVLISIVRTVARKIKCEKFMVIIGF